MLARAGKSLPVTLFARNQLCALARPRLAVEPDILLDRMLEAPVRLGTSTPRADPSGDYAWEVFRRANAQRPGSFATLSHKALQLTAGPTSVTVPAGRSRYGMLVSQGHADIFLALVRSRRRGRTPGQRGIALPDNLAVGADYGLTVMNTASP